MLFKSSQVCDWMAKWLIMLSFMDLWRPRVVGAAPTGDAPTTSELSTIFLPTKVRLILVTHFCIKHDQIFYTGSGHLPLELTPTKNVNEICCQISIRYVFGEQMCSF